MSDLSTSSNVPQTVHHYEVKYTSRPLMPSDSHKALALPPPRLLLANPTVPYPFRLPKPTPIKRTFCGCPCLICNKHSRDILEPFQQSVFVDAMNFISSRMNEAFRVFGLDGNQFFNPFDY